LHKSFEIAYLHKTPFDETDEDVLRYVSKENQVQ